VSRPAPGGAEPCRHAYGRGLASRMRMGEATAVPSALHRAAAIGHDGPAAGHAPEHPSSDPARLDL
jgi:hypothetical protein